MTFRSTVTIVASPRSRVGKTLLARLLVDYHRQENRGVQAFDLNTGENTLAQFLPGEVTAAGVGNVQSQMALFDLLVSPDETAKIVDVGHEAFESFFTLAHRIGFAEEARRRDIAPVILFMIGADPVSAEAYRNLRVRFPRATLSPVHNEMLGSGQYRDKFPSAGAGAAQLRFPALAPGCADISSSRRSRFPTRNWPTPSIFRSTCISNCSDGCEKCISSSANWICAFCWPICRLRCNLRRKLPKSLDSDEFLQSGGAAPPAQIGYKGTRVHMARSCLTTCAGFRVSVGG